MRGIGTIISALLATVWLGNGGAYADVELKVARFFDPCIDENTDIDLASGEACIVHSLLTAFSDEDNGITVDLLPSGRDNYYAQLVAAYAEGTPPDVHLLHRHRLLDFADDGQLAALGDDLSAANVDIADWQDTLRDSITIDDQIVAMPFDLHANLWHVNLGLMAKAGLVANDGRPMLPGSPGELMDHARKIEKATGKAYLAADFVQYPIGVRSVLSLLWQQGENIVDDGEVRVNTAQMRAAITTFTDLFEAGLADPAHNYEEAQQAFLDGDVAVLINGTWAVDFYDKEVSRGYIGLNDYDVADFPTLFDEPATWADAHLWAVPERLKTERPDVYDAAIELLAWIDGHNLDWARTGHLAIRTSVLESDAYGTLSHRIDYRKSADIGRDLTVVNRYDDIHNVLKKGLQAIWTRDVPIDRALAGAEAGIERLLQ